MRRIYGDMNGGFNPIKDLYKHRSLSGYRACAMPGGPKARCGPAGVVIPVDDHSHTRADC